MLLWEIFNMVREISLWKAATTTVISISKQATITAVYVVRAFFVRMPRIRSQYGDKSLHEWLSLYKDENPALGPLTWAPAVLVKESLRGTRHRFSFTASLTDNLYQVALSFLWPLRLPEAAALHQYLHVTRSAIGLITSGSRGWEDKGSLSTA